MKLVLMQSSLPELQSQCKILGLNLNEA